MADILVVEDDPFKFGELQRLIREAQPTLGVISALSVKEAVSALAEREYKCILLDIALPSHSLDKGQGAPMSLPSGGTEVLMELSYLDRRDPVIIVTQYPEIEVEGRLYPLSRVKKVINELMNVSLLGVVRFDRLSDKWRPELDCLLRSLS